MKTEQPGIAIVLNGLYVGGAEKFGISLANRFAASGIRSHIVLFREMESPLRNQIDARVTLISIRRKSKYDFIKHREFDAEMVSRNIDRVIIIGLLPLFLTRVFRWGRKMPYRSFLSLHSTIPASKAIYLQNLFFLRFAKKQDQVMFICKAQQEFYRKQYYFNPAQQVVIYNGVDTDWYNPTGYLPPKNIRKELEIPEGDPVILLVATLRPEKGHADAIQALRELHQQYPTWNKTHLLCLGGGPEKYIQQLKHQAAEQHLNNFVHFAGNQTDVRPYQSASTLFTLTSFSVETFSIAALEAMSFGLPASLTRIGGAAEMIQEGINGSLSEPRNPASIAASWHRILQNPPQPELVRQQVQQHFSLNGMFTAYDALIQSKQA